MIPLRVAVHHPGALQKGLVLELLRERRLTRPERANAENRGIEILL